MLHVDRQGGTWKLLGSVVYTHRQVQHGEVLDLIQPHAGADHHTLYWLPWPHLRQLLHLPE